LWGVRLKTLKETQMQLLCKHEKTWRSEFMHGEEKTIVDGRRERRCGGGGWFVGLNRDRRVGHARGKGKKSPQKKRNQSLSRQLRGGDSTGTEPTGMSS